MAALMLLSLATRITIELYGQPCMYDRKHADIGNWGCAIVVSAADVMTLA